MVILLNILLALFISGEGYTHLDLFIKSHLDKFDRIEYTVVSPNNLENELFEIDNSRDFKLSGKYAYIPIKINKGGNITNALVTIKLRAFKKVLIANRYIKKHEILNKGDFNIVEKEITKLQDVVYPFEDELSNYRAKRNIRENSIITERLIEKTPLVKRGDRLKAFFNNSALKIEFNVVARTEGKKGDIIKVKRHDNKLFIAEIIDDKNVKIIE